MLGEDPDEERGGHGSGGGNPAPAATHRRTHGFRALSGRERNHASRTAQMIDLLQNPGVLPREPIGREQLVGFVDRPGRSRRASVEASADAPAFTSFARAQMRLVERSDRIRQTNLDQSIVGEVSAAHTRRPLPIERRVRRRLGLRRQAAREQLAELADRAEEMHAHGGLAQAQCLTDFARRVLGDVAEGEDQPLPIGQLLDRRGDLVVRARST